MLRKNLLLGAAIATASLLNVANAYTLKPAISTQQVLVATEVKDVSTTATKYELLLEFGADALGDGPVFLDVTLTGGKFSTAVTGDALKFGCLLTGPVRGVSTGGKKGDTEIRFRIEKASGCSGKTGTAAMIVKIGVSDIVSGTPMAFATSLTDAQVDGVSFIDNGTPSNGSPLKFIDYEDAYSVEVSTVSSGKTVKALLDSSPKFSSLLAAPTASTVTEIGEVKLDFITQRKSDSKAITLDAAKTAVEAPVLADYTKVKYTITGDFSFAKEDSTEKKNQKKLTTQGSGSKIEYADDYASATVTYPTNPGAIDKIYIAGKSEVPFNASDYTIAVAYELAHTDVAYTKQSPTAGALASVVREGTTLTFPWVSSASQGAVSGSTNVIRIGNLTSSALGAVSARVKNATKSGFVVKATTTDLVSSVPANGELVVTSADLQAKLGDWGRGDVEIVVEESAKSITANRLVVSGSRIVNVDAGKADKYSDQ